MIDVDTIAERLPSHLPNQRWFGAKDRAIEKVVVAEVAELRPPWPGLFHLLVETHLAGGAVGLYQLLVGVRPAGQHAEFLHGSEHAVLGEVDTPEGHGYAYDALLDHELSLALLTEIAPGEDAHLVRPSGVEQSNSSLVYDDRLMLKVFRHVSDGPNLDIEVTAALAAQGFEHVAAPLAVWRRDGRDLAVVQPYLAGATDGWALSLTSLRDLLDQPRDPAVAGGDFASEAERLGQLTAAMHVALAHAFGRHTPDPDAWAADMAVQLERTNHPDLDKSSVAAVLGRLRGLADAGTAVRVHGDLHLGQVLRTDAGWYVLDFEGEPARPIEERRRPSSPLRDVAGMVRSFDYAARVAVLERNEQERDESLVAAATAWAERNRTAFLEGYFTRADDTGLVPPETTDQLALLAAFELDKAVYELAYELAHRPAWVDIPLEAIRRITQTGGPQP